MANFVDATGKRISASIVPGEGKKLRLGLWGFEESPGQPLKVATSIPGVTVVPSTRSGVTQFYDLEARQLGKTRVEARSKSGGVWDYVDVEFSASSGASLADAAQNKRVVFNKAEDFRLVQQFAAGTAGKVVIAPEISRLLVRLSEHAVVTVMSLYRYKNGPHGTVQADGSVICRAVDITGYGGLAVTLGDPEKAIAVVTDLISHFPIGPRYDLGFPRPVGKHGFNASQDVFFAVRTQLEADMAYAGTAGTPLSKMLDPAQQRVRMAMAASGAKFVIFYPDGLDHLHIKAY